MNHWSFINRSGLQKKKKKSLTSTNQMELQIAAYVIFIKGLFSLLWFIKFLKSFPLYYSHI